MARPKKDLNKSKRKDGLYEYKGTVGKNMHGKAIRKSFYSSVSLDDAKRQYEEYKVNQKAAEITGTVFVDVNKGTTFGEWALRWLEMYKQPSVSDNTYMNSYYYPTTKHLIPFFGNADLKTIQPLNIQEFFNSKKDLSQAYLGKLRMCIVSIFDSAIENELCYKNPARSKTLNVASGKEKVKKRVLTSEQIKTVCELTTAPEIKAMLYTGMRRGEICGLMWSDIDLEKGVYSVNRSVAVKRGGGIYINKPKWNSYRTNPIEKEFRALLEKLAKNKLSPLYVFPNINGDVQNPATLAQKVEAQMQKLPPDIPRLSPHEMRHTYGTNLNRRGVPIFAIQKIMGHKDINMTTEIYVHSEVEVLQQAINLADILENPQMNKKA